MDKKYNDAEYLRTLSIKELRKILPNRRNKAYEEGYFFYIADKKCAKGHMTFRWRANWNCDMCRQTHEETSKSKATNAKKKLRNGRELTMGDTRVRKGKTEYFLEYRNRASVDENGYLKEYWTDEAGYLKNRVQRAVKGARKNHIKRGHSFDLTWEEALDIFPKDNKCPILGIPFVWGDHGQGKDNSPSLDRIHQKIGYHVENMIWVCNRVNSIKRDSDSEELLKIGNFYKKLEEKTWKRNIQMVSARTRVNSAIRKAQKLSDEDT